MTVFAKEDRMVVVIPGKVFFLQFPDGRIHPAVHVHVRTVGIFAAFRFFALVSAAGSVFGMDQAPGHAAVEIICHGAVVLTDAAFVSDRPHDDGTVVFISLHQPFGAVQIGFCPFGTVGKHVPNPNRCEPVSFDIRLVAKIDAQHIAKTGQTGVGGVVTRPDHVAVE